MGIDIEKSREYQRKRNKLIKEGVWDEHKLRQNLEDLSDEEKRIRAYSLRKERRKQYTIEIDKDKAAIFDERLKQYGDKAAEIFRIALDKYLSSHPNKDI